MYDNEGRSKWKSPVAAAAFLCAAAFLLLALKVLIDDPRVQTELAAARQAHERKQIQRYEAKRFEEQERIDEDVLRNVQPYHL